LLVIFLIIGLLRAAFWRGRGWNNGGWFEDWHRRAHDPSAPPKDPSA
jgi:hypothetical protein